MLAAFLAALLLIAWIAVLFWLGNYSFDNWGSCYGSKHMRAVCAAVAAALLLAGGMAVLAHGERSLCTRGHEEYQRIGKTMHRVWVCDEREQ